MAELSEFHYVPDEICIFVEAEEADAVNDGQRLYAEVVGRVARLGVEVRPLRRAGWRGDPWVTLPFKGEVTVLCGYQIGGPVDTPEGAERGARSVRDAVNAINKALLDGADRPHGERTGVHLAVAMPNWLTAAGQNGYTAPGPGSDPVPVPPGSIADPANFGRFQFANPALQQLVDDRHAEAQGPPNVFIVAFDTCPDIENDPANSTFTTFQNRNWLFELLDKQHVKINDPALLDASFDQHLVIEEHPEPMPDHGLFVTGILRQLAPSAQINLVRVLDRHGVGNMLALVGNMYTVLQRLRLDHPQARIVVNDSLRFTLPSEQILVDEYTGVPAPNLPGIAGNGLQFIHYLGTIVRGFVTDGWCDLTVAMAGNDGDGTAPPLTAYPARYRSVLGVASINAANVPSRFANRSDLAPDVGIAVFGGEVDAMGGLIEGVISISTAPDPAAAAPTSGWARWAGSSFSTAIISAIAANLWAEDPSRTPAQVRREIRSLAGPSVPALMCKAILVTQL